MADQLDAVAQLRLIVQGAREVANDLERIKEGTLDLDDGVDKAQKKLASLGKTAKSVSGDLDKLGNAARDTSNKVDKGTTEWTQYANAITEAQKAQRTFSQSQVAAKFGPASSIPALPASQMSSKQRQALLAAYDAGNSSVISEARALENASQRMSEHAARARYALYDVSTTAAITATAITGVGVAASAAFASVESAFTNVERTLESANPAQVAALREELMQLTREIPLAFTDVAAIATLGNQLGIASGDVASFTETIARFSAVTGVTAESAAQSFGSMGEILGVSASQYENLGSAIAYVARTSVATDQEILALSREIGQQATSAGFAADEVIGLAGALASLRLPPERSRGALTTYFATVNQLIAEGGDELELFSQLVGRSSDQLQNDVIAGKGLDIFRDFAQSLSSLNTIQRTDVLDTLGLSDKRLADVLERVNQNLNVFDKSMEGASRSFAEGTELASQYALVIDDLASRWQVFINAVVEAGAAVGEALAPALIVGLELLTGFLQGFAEFAQTPLGTGFLVVAGVIAGITAALAGLVAITALGAASFLAIKTAVTDLGISAAWASGGVRGLTGAMLGLGASATHGAIALRIFRAALITTGVGALVVALGVAVAFLMDFEGTVVDLQQPILWFIDAGYNMAKAVLYAGRGIAQFMSQLPLVGQAFSQIANMSDKTIESLVEVGRTAVKSNFKRYVKGIEDARDASSGAADAMEAWDDSMAGAGGQLIDLGEEAEKTAEKVRTLVDYAGDLGTVFDRAFEIRFSSGQALDTITTSWNAIAKETAAAQAEMEQYKGELAELGADRNIKKYWLSIAEMYGDTLRAAKLREELAELDRKQAETQKKLATAQEKTNMSLVGNSDAAIENRAEILGLVQNYQAYLRALAASGASQETLIAESTRLRGEFVAQATRLGYNRDEIALYASAFDDATIAIQNVPRDITVTANVNPALQALNELRARTAATATDMSNSLSKAFATQPVLSQNNPVDEQLKKRARLMWYMAQIAEAMANSIAAAAGGKRAEAILWRTKVAVMTAVVNSGGYEQGGYTGNGGRKDVAGFVHGQEFVFSAPAVKNLGVGNLANLHELGKSGKSGGGMGMGNGVGRLHPADIDAIGRSMAYHFPGVVIPGVGIQKANAYANAGSNARGRT